MAEKHPDTPGNESSEEALNEPTQENMERLGRADLDEEPDPQAHEQDDSTSPPGQNSDWLPE